MRWSLDDDNIGVVRNLESGENLFSVYFYRLGEKARIFTGRYDDNIVALLLEDVRAPDQPVMTAAVGVSWDDIHLHRR